MGVMNGCDGWGAEPWSQCSTKAVTEPTYSVLGPQVRVRVRVRTIVLSG